MLKTTRQGAAYAMTMQAVGGEAVQVVGGSIYRDAPYLWSFVRATGELAIAGSISDILSYLFVEGTS